MDQNTQTLADFKKLVWVLPPETKPDNRKKLRIIKAAIDKIENQDEKDDLFGFEGFEDGTNELLLELKRKAMQLKMTLAGYPEQLDFTPLSWCKKNSGLPVFMILDLENNTFSLSVEAYDDDEPDVEFSIELPETISNLFGQAIKTLETMSKENNYDVFTISARFSGIVPSETRKKIKKAISSSLFDEIFIIAEAPEWQIDQTPFVKRDPLIVGWVEETEQLFIIDIFDPTPLEEYLKVQHIITI